jgi:hypothetical protein
VHGDRASGKVESDESAVIHCRAPNRLHEVLDVSESRSFQDLLLVGRRGCGSKSEAGALWHDSQSDKPPDRDQQLARHGDDGDTASSPLKGSDTLAEPLGHAPRSRPRSSPNAATRRLDRLWTRRRAVIFPRHALRTERKIRHFAAPAGTAAGTCVGAGRPAAPFDAGPVLLRELVMIAIWVMPFVASLSITATTSP